MANGLTYTNKTARERSDGVMADGLTYTNKIAKDRLKRDCKGTRQRPERD